MTNPAHHTPARRSRTVLLTVVPVAALVTGAALGRWVFPTESPAGGDSGPVTGTAPAGGIVAAPHGPAKFTHGVPSGYTRDRAGAATAGVNAVQLVNNLAHGQASPEIASTTWPASTADEGTRQALATRSGSADQTSKIPATTRVTAYADSSASVEVWVVAVGSGDAVGGGTNTAARWSTHTIQLRWENGDWKVAGLRANSGPQPGDTGATPVTEPLTNGLYTYYIN
ncbi:hypothetical protein CFP71_40570 [Amycolatopsis thailandensis]|uniref:DUF8175 domain-containing protein n=1 Tax=Amycolatopsis thailandensis TaxID=589330 RepID=A0A229RC56_9PSEU|nr:hypothetical protein [Amycolatopsis thailandensis]OXM44250.1 hypothetical protein CFP71_40570 [Amycolatopsis thailandensis]